MEKNYLRCPNCQRRLKDLCPTCGEPVDPRWSLCPYCETALSGGERSPQPRRRGRRKPEDRELERERELEETGTKPPVRRSRKGGKSGQAGQKQRASATAAAEGDTRRRDRNLWLPQTGIRPQRLAERGADHRTKTKEPPP